MLYTRTWLLKAGMHPRILASGQMDRALPGYFMRSDAPADLRTIAEAVQRYVRPGAVISHGTAAELYKFPLPRHLTRDAGAPISCRVVGSGKKTTGALLEVYVRAEAPAIRFLGLTVSHPVTTLQEIAGSMPHVDLVACVDAVVAGRKGAAWHVPLSQVRRSVASLKGRGAAALRRAVLESRERVWSPMETKMRLLINSRGYPEPATNLEICEIATGIVYYIDLAYPQWKIAIEYDGKGHRTDKQQWERDLHKNEVLHGQGWTVLRVSIADFRDPGDFFRRLDAAIAAREHLGACPSMFDRVGRSIGHDPGTHPAQRPHPEQRRLGA